MNMQREKLVREIEMVLNANGEDARVGFPDYVMAEYLVSCLEAFRRAVPIPGSGSHELSSAVAFEHEAKRPKHYPPGMGEESRRLHREYNALVAAQNAGAKNGAEVVKLTDEAGAKGIVLVPGGENL